MLHVCADVQAILIVSQLFMMCCLHFIAFDVTGTFTYDAGSQSAHERTNWKITRCSFKLCDVCASSRSIRDAIMFPRQQLENLPTNLRLGCFKAIFSYSLEYSGQKNGTNCDDGHNGSL
jgi:hypothetical protein